MSAAKKKKTTGRVIWFELGADDTKRAKTFYGKLFGWKMTRFPGDQEYWRIDTGGPETSLDGGLILRANPKQSVTNYINVESVEKSAKKVVKLGGQVCSPKTEVPGMGFFILCTDTENNPFALWEMAMQGR